MYLYVFDFTLLFYFFFSSPCLFLLFSLLYSSVDTLLRSCFLLCVLVGFVFNWLVSLWVSSVRQVTPLNFVFFGVLWFRVCRMCCVCECSLVFVFICLILLLPFVWGSFLVSWVFVCLLFVLIPFITEFLPGESQGQRSLAAVYGVTQSQTRLKRLSSSSSSIAITNSL